MNADTPKRAPLGRGLNALFGDEPAQPAPTENASRSTSRVAIDLIAPSPLQPRRHFDQKQLDELAASIREKDILQPILVRPAREEGRFEIVAGERRWRAAQQAQLHDVPVIVREMTDAELLEFALIENLQRADLSAIEEARGYQRMLDEFGHTQERVAEIVGKSRAHVANTLRLLALPEEVQRRIETGELSAGQARPLIGLRNAGALAEQVIKRSMSARQVETLARQRGDTKKRKLSPPAPPVGKDADTRALEQTLERATGYTVNISFDGEGGIVSINYKSLEQLDDIVRLLTNAPRKAKDVGDESAGFSIKDPDRSDQI
ncbi:MAG: ParB/RepB/Spo0J family partition protein [Alphaproteobacteria bacterium]|nr:ParB/RepB/Spo0J family partition protein [Alphaproteobacteria bacterium]